MSRKPPQPKRKPRAFSDTFVATLKPTPGRREETIFEPLTGLGVRISATNRSFVLQLRLKDGRRYRETLGAFGKLSVSQARAAANAIAGDIARGVDPFKAREDAVREARLSEQARKFSLGVLIDRWRRDHLSNMRLSYASRAVAAVRNHFPQLLARPAASLSKQEVREAVEHARTNHGPGAARTANANLRAAIRWATSEDLLASDPLTGLKPPPSSPGRDRTLTTDEARRVYAAAAALDYPASQFIRLLMLCGCRRAEIGGLKWSEIVEEADGWAIQLPPERTKSGGGHHIPLSRAALAVIDECRSRRVVGSPFLLTSDGWRPFNNHHRARAALDRALAEDGAPIEDFRLHDFRRTIVSLLAAKPFRYDPTVLDLLLGHQPTLLTPVARIYAREKHLDVRREALAAWGEHLTQPPQPRRVRRGHRRDRQADLHLPSRRPRPVRPQRRREDRGDAARTRAGSQHSFRAAGSDDGADRRPQPADSADQAQRPARQTVRGRVRTRFGRTGRHPPRHAAPDRP
jgi:integrase